MTRWLPFVVIGLVMVPSIAATQTRTRLGVFGEVEKTAIENWSGILDSRGPGWNAGLEWRFTETIAFEVEVGHVHHAKDVQDFISLKPGGPANIYPITEHRDDSHSTLTARLSRVYGPWRVKPVIWAGGGLLHYSGLETRVTDTSKVPPGEPVSPNALVYRGRGRAVDEVAIDAGLGMQVLVTERIGVRPYVGLRVGLQNNAVSRGGVRMAIRW